MSNTTIDRPESRNLLARIRAVLPDLRPSEARIARYVVADPTAASAASVAMIAGVCQTSSTSVVRFCRRVGYEGFKDLRVDLAREAARESLEAESTKVLTGDIGRTDSLADLVGKIAANERMSIADTAEVLDIDALAGAVAALRAATRIDIFGVGASSVVRLDLQQKLTRIGLTALGWEDAHSAWTSASILGPGSVAVSISHSGTTPETLAYARLARESGAVSVVLTNHEGSPLAAEADFVLATAVRESGFRSGALGSRIAQLMLVDCLFTGVAQASYDRSMAALERTYEAVSRTART